MNEIQHCAIDIAAGCNYDWVVENLVNGNLLKPYINLPPAAGALYSHIAINKIIEEELLHDHFEITTANNKSLKSMSSGEQKKALLQYIISKKPGFIVIDNVLDNLDTAAQENIIASLKTIAATTLIVQVVNRKKDILPFIEKIFSIQNNIIIKDESIVSYLNAATTIHANHFFENIPPALHAYTLPAGPLVQLHDVSVSYEERQILDQINWTINAGEFWQLAGPNGSGKSTILSLITGDSPKGYGQDLVLFGIKKGSGEAVWDIKQNIGYLNATMAQFFSRLDSVEKMVLSGLFDSIGLYVVPNETQIKTAQAWLQLIGLYEDRNKPFCFLPLGKQRMVLVARAMIKHPPLLILDEPASGLDDYNIMLFTTLINKIAAESNTAILYVSHRPEAGLTPRFVFNLLPGENGSTGVIQNS
ncbi:ATP-binding cassette domain-containing protein [Ferruginibacter sp. SUN106]|uniref:ATP-binding cassette domain-containing protein n=1 Tax=Ferruginibacter sp. SUN106 TaxID=2978348 RepID=UPI003D3605D6